MNSQVNASHKIQRGATSQALPLFPSEKLPLHLGEGLSPTRFFAIDRKRQQPRYPPNLTIVPIKLCSVRKRRHYRGGLNRAGMTNRARELRTNQTRAESCLRERLRNGQMLGFKFRRQHQFGNYIADFYCHEAQLVIECDGSIHNLNDSWQHDQSRDVYMIGQGLRVLRFSNEEVLENTGAVLLKIAEYLPSSRDDAAHRA
jgi:very-short-patch-repair endonuclease